MRPRETTVAPTSEPTPGTRALASRVRPLAAVALIVALPSLSACGGGSKSASTTPTKAQYVAAVEPICKALVEENIKLGLKGLTPKVLQEGILGRERADARLRAVRMPADNKIPSEWLRWRELTVAELKAARASPPESEARLLHSAKESFARSRAHRLARAYGLPSCAEAP